MNHRGGDDSLDNSSSSSSQSKPNYDKPDASDSTVIYQKRALPTIRRGDQLKLDEYFAVVPGKNEDASATSFQAYVVKGENDPYVGYLTAGDGKGLDLLFVSTGQVVVNLYANGVYETVTFTVKENSEMEELVEKLSEITNNYTATQRSYDDEGNEQVVQKIYRTKNYIYSETQKVGYLLSKKDDNIYGFELDSKDSDEDNLKVDMAVQGDKADYNGTFCSFDTLANPSYWQYSQMLSSNPKLKKFKYAFIASSSLTKRIFKSLFYLSSSYNGYYPYLVFASYQNGELTLLPVLSNSAGTAIASFNEFKITDVGTTSVSALDQYIANYKAPEPADVTAITDAIKYLGELKNYTADGQIYFIGADGNRLGERSPYMEAMKGVSNVTGVNKSLPNLTRYAGLKKLTKEAYWGERWGGTSESTYTKGGLWSTNKTTYYYYETEKNSGQYAVTKECAEMTSSTSAAKTYPNWWSYSFMSRQLISLAITNSQIKGSYPLYNEKTDTYTFNGNTTTSLGLMTSVISSFYHNDSATSSNALTSYLLPMYGEMTWKVTYSDEEKDTVSGMNIVLCVKLPVENFPAFDQDYYWYLDVNIYDVGNTTLDTIVSQLSVPTTTGEGE